MAYDQNVVALYVPRVVRATHVICTNTNLVHPTWLARTIPGVCVSNVSMRHVIPKLVAVGFSFCEHVNSFAFRCFWFWHKTCDNSREEAEARYMKYLAGERRERRNRMKTSFIVIPILLIVTAFLFYVIIV